MHDVLHEIFLKTKMYKEYNKKTIEKSMVLWSWRVPNRLFKSLYLSTFLKDGALATHRFTHFENVGF